MSLDCAGDRKRGAKRKVVTHRGDFGLQELRRQERVVAEDYMNRERDVKIGVEEWTSLRKETYHECPR